MKFDQLEYQRAAYDRHYPRMARVVREQLAHPLLSSFYDRLARLIFDLGLDSNQQRLRPDSEPIRLLEAGCGEGLVGSAIQRVAAERDLQLAYTGVELSAAGAELASSVLTGDLLVGDAAEVVSQLEPGSQDIVVAKNLLHHLEDPAAFLRSALAAVGPSGRVVIVEPRMWCPIHWINVIWFPRQERYQFLGYRRNLAAFKDAGAVLLRAEPFGWLPYELALAIRFDRFRRLLSSRHPRFLGRISRLDERLTATLPRLALYAVSALAMADPVAGPDADASPTVRSDSSETPLV